MAVISHINTQEARHNPEAVFETPAALLAEVGLTAGQKLAALERWAAAVDERLARAVDTDRAAADRDLLVQIKSAAAHITSAP
jgi:hypothetical protein